MTDVVSDGECDPELLVEEDIPITHSEQGKKACDSAIKERHHTGTKSHAGILKKQEVHQRYQSLTRDRLRVAQITQ